MSQKNIVSFDPSALGQAAQRKQQDTFVVRLPHPLETDILTLLDSIAQGGEDVAEKVAEARKMLTEDGIHISFSTQRLDDNGQPGGFYRDFDTGLPILPPNQFLLYRSVPKGVGQDDGKVLYRSFGGRGQRPGCVKAFMAWASNAWRVATGIGQGAQAPAGGIPVGTQATAEAGRQQVRLS